MPVLFLNFWILLVISLDMPIFLRSSLMTVLIMTAVISSVAQATYSLLRNSSLKFFYTFNQPCSILMSLIIKKPSLRYCLRELLSKAVIAFLRFLSNCFLRAAPISLLSGSQVYLINLSSSDSTASSRQLSSSLMYCWTSIRS